MTTSGPLPSAMFDAGLRGTRFHRAHDSVGSSHVPILDRQGGSKKTGAEEPPGCTRRPAHTLD